MKKLTFVILLLAFMSATVNINAQYVVTKETTKVVVANPSGQDVVNIYSDYQEENKMTIRVAGMEITLRGDDPAPKASQQKPVPARKAKPKRFAYYGSNPYQAFIEVGVNTLPSVDYSMYRRMDMPGVPANFMTLNNMKSLQWAFSLMDMTLFLNRSRSFAFSMGLQMVFDDYVFAEDITLQKMDGMLVPVDIGPGYKKSKLNTFSFKVPVMFHLGRSNRFNIAAGVYGGVVLGAHTKIKKPVEKMYDPYIEPFYAGAVFRAGFRDWYVYANYGLTELFKEKRGPAVMPVTIGIGLGF